MATMQKARTTKISGGADYAKVAERLKLFREQNPKSKHESAYETDQEGNTIFTVWLWRDKSELLDLIKAGITDKDTLRSSADANGTAKSSGKSLEKSFEKLESIALGRALANAGYLASGEIASLDEMEEFQEYRNEKVRDAIDMLNSAESMDQLKELFMSLGNLVADKQIIEAKNKKKAEFNAGS